ncbi:motility associated factor glycosyltransferase family protein, partial [Campylobacter jejuni]|nr:motility associated factor glycosyltransferase family protein [Campylobacter jejuni]
TAEFFNHDFGEFDKDVWFVLKSYAHPHTTKYLQKNNRNFILVSAYANFINYLKLDDFGYFSMGFSVANMAYRLALLLQYKNIILIGQDLAYAKNGNSHPDEHIFGTLDGEKKETISYDLQTTAYGGEGLVYTQEVWNLFRNIFEQDITNYHITTYNCTEGGARIEGAIEKPFLWACENLLAKDLDKPFEKLEPLSLNKQNEFLLKAYYKVYQSIKHCKDFNKILSNDFNNIQSIYLSLNEKEEYLNLAIEKIDEFKNKLEDIKQMQDLYEILGPLLTQFELNLARIYVLNPKTKEDVFNKSILWIKEHLEFMELVYGHIKAQENALIKNILPLEEKLKERKLDKWMKRR